MTNSDDYYFHCAVCKSDFTVTLHAGARAEVFFPAVSAAHTRVSPACEADRFLWLTRPGASRKPYV